MPDTWGGGWTIPKRAWSNLQKKGGGEVGRPLGEDAGDSGNIEGSAGSLRFFCLAPRLNEGLIVSWRAGCTPVNSIRRLLGQARPALEGSVVSTTTIAVWPTHLPYWAIAARLARALGARLGPLLQPGRLYPWPQSGGLGTSPSQPTWGSVFEHAYKLIACNRKLNASHKRACSCLFVVQGARPRPRRGGCNSWRKSGPPRATPVLLHPAL